MLELQPITYKEAQRFIKRYHRHFPSFKFWKFGVGVNDGERVVGVAVAMRPSSRHLDDGWTIEVTRVCTDGTRNAPSMLYGAMCRASFALGYQRVITYTLATENGGSLRAAGFREVHTTRGQSWNRKTRPRVDGPHSAKSKTLWEKISG